MILICATFLSFISTILAATECAQNWTAYERTGSCFLVVSDRLLWSAAETHCVALGGHLASITDEFENIFAFDLAKHSNLSVQTVWLGKIVEFTNTGAYKWHDGQMGSHAEGFRGEHPSSSDDLCMSMWLDFDRAQGSWLEWDCAYSLGYSALCKTTSIHSVPPGEIIEVKQVKKKKEKKKKEEKKDNMHMAVRCCSNGLNETVDACVDGHCSRQERCIPDDLDCWTRQCADSTGWCLPLP